MNTELYKQLSITPDATQDDIRDAYRRRVKACHPDVGGDPEAFRRVQQAYDVLSDPERRERYDRLGSTDTMNEEERLDAVARERFAGMLMQLIDKISDPFLFRRDLIQLAKDSVAQEKRGIERDNREIASKRDHTEKLAARFKPKGERNVPRDVFAHMVRQLDQAKAINDNKLKVIERLASMCDEYEFERDPGQDTPQRTAFTINDLLGGMR